MPAATRTDPTTLPTTPPAAHGAHPSCCHGAGPAAATAAAPVHHGNRPPPQGLALWRTAALNTAVCLLGCSLGDVGVVVATRTIWTSCPMALAMVLAVVAGLCTSLTLETVWLIARGSAARAALAQAARMSLLSMVAMELAMNVIDLGLTGGVRLGLPWPAYLRILALGEVAGFLVPLPYNAWRLSRGRACH